MSESLTMMVSWVAAFTKSIRTPTLALGVVVEDTIRRAFGNSRMTATAGSLSDETPHNNSASSLACDARASRRLPPAPLTGFRMETFWVPGCWLLLLDRQ